MKAIWRRLLGRDTLRDPVANPPWDTQHHEWQPGLHYPGDKCRPVIR